VSNLLKERASVHRLLCGGESERSYRQLLQGQRLDAQDKKKAKKRVLLDQELNLKHYLHVQLDQLLREVEIKWYKKAKTKNLLEGDDNTQYFHLVANDKHRKQRILELEQEEGVIVSDVELKAYITNYYLGLFRSLEKNNLA
jgi:hypothetical protein